MGGGEGETITSLDFSISFVSTTAPLFTVFKTRLTFRIKGKSKYLYLCVRVVVL